MLIYCVAASLLIYLNLSLISNLSSAASPLLSHHARLVLPGGRCKTTPTGQEKSTSALRARTPRRYAVQVPHTAAQGPTAVHSARSRAKGVAEIASMVDSRGADLFDLKDARKRDIIACAAAVHVLLAIRAARVARTPRGDRARRVPRPPPRPFRRRKKPPPPPATFGAVSRWVVVVAAPCLHQSRCVQCPRGRRCRARTSVPPGAKSGPAAPPAGYQYSARGICYMGSGCRGRGERRTRQRRHRRPRPSTLKARKNVDGAPRTTNRAARHRQAPPPPPPRTVPAVGYGLAGGPPKYRRVGPNRPQFRA